MSAPDNAPELRRIPVPASYYLGGHGDPIAQFDHLVLLLHPDGRVTWESSDPDGEIEDAAVDAIDRWVRGYVAMGDKLRATLAEARHQRDEAGRSERGRLLAVLTTDLERCVALWEYLERQEPSAVEGEDAPRLDVIE